MYFSTQTNNTLFYEKMHLAIGYTEERSPEAAAPICGSLRIGGGSENPPVYSC